MPKKVETKDAPAIQIGDLEDIEGIGPKYRADLRKVGVKTTEDLRKISMVELAELTNISTKLIFKWQCMSDLFRVRRAAEEYTELLFEMGVETVKELSKQDPEELLDRILDFAKEAKKKKGWAGDVKRPPDLDDVKEMVESAKELVKK